jgi:hypothetical protein
MKTILSILIAGILLSACSVKEPRLTFGKKCVTKNDKIVYSYVWLYDKQVGLPANTETCKLIKK